MNKTAIVFILISVFIIILVLLSKVTYISTVTIDGHAFQVEVAETKYFLQKGLSGHKALKSNEGMFFVFEIPDNYGFWMKDMTFPIDIIWIGPDFKINHIEQGVTPETYPKVFYPEAPSKYVLEVSSGRSETLNFKIGDTVEFTRKAGKSS